MDILTHWLTIGLVGKAHGLNGAFFVSGRDEPIPSEIDSVIIGDQPEFGKKGTIKKARAHHGKLILELDIFTDRGAVELLKGRKIWISREQLKIDAASEYCWADLVGRRLIDSSGVVMGKVERVINYGASDVLVIVADDGKQLEIPFVAEYFNMDFEQFKDEIYLQLEANIFAEAWEN